MSSYIGDMRIECYKEGAVARVMGCTLKACPYDSEEEFLQYEAWMDGYRTAGQNEEKCN